MQPPLLELELVLELLLEVLELELVNDPIGSA